MIFMLSLIQIFPYIRSILQVAKNGTNSTSKFYADSLQHAPDSGVRNNLGRSGSNASSKLFASNLANTSSPSSKITGSNSSLLVLTMDSSSSNFSFPEFVIY